jgi:hypothetical protein
VAPAAHDPLVALGQQVVHRPHPRRIERHYRVGRLRLRVRADEHLLVPARLRRRRPCEMRGQIPVQRRTPAGVRRVQQVMLPGSRRRIRRNWPARSDPGAIGEGVASPQAQAQRRRPAAGEVEQARVARQAHRSELVVEKPVRGSARRQAPRAVRVIALRRRRTAESARRPAGAGIEQRLLSGSTRVRETMHRADRRATALTMDAVRGTPPMEGGSASGWPGSSAATPRLHPAVSACGRVRSSSCYPAALPPQASQHRHQPPRSVGGGEWGSPRQEFACASCRIGGATASSAALRAAGAAAR